MSINLLSIFYEIIDVYLRTDYLRLYYRWLDYLKFESRRLLMTAGDTVNFYESNL